MKLRNKKTGEIIEKYSYSFVINSGEQIRHYDSLGELYAEWEDYEEPKESKEPKKYWFINSGGETASYYEEDEEPEDTEACKEIGNYFNTREEAEKAVEKLKAWKRLKDKGAKVIGYYCDGGTNTKGEFSGEVNFTIDVPQEVNIDLFNLLFSGEDD